MCHSLLPAPLLPFLLSCLPSSFSPLSILRIKNGANASWGNSLPQMSSAPITLLTRIKWHFLIDKLLVVKKVLYILGSRNAFLF